MPLHSNYFCHSVIGQFWAPVGSRISLAVKNTLQPLNGRGRMLPLSSGGKQHLHEETALGQCADEVVLIEKLFQLETQHLDLRQFEEQLTKPVRKLVVPGNGQPQKTAVLEQSRAHLTTELLHKAAVSQARCI